MTSYELHVQQVNFQLVSAHHALQSLTRQFGGDLLIDAIKRFEERDRQIVTDPERVPQQEAEHVLQ
jgi:hypothetical protein